MRFSRRLLAYLFVVAIAGSAFATGPSQGTDTLAPPETISSQSSTQLQFIAPGASPRFAVRDRLARHRNDSDIASDAWQSPDESTCFMMRTYRVRRIDKTDATRDNGYTTCLPAGSVQWKSAVGQRK